MLFISSTSSLIIFVNRFCFVTARSSAAAAAGPASASRFQIQLAQFSRMKSTRATKSTTVKLEAQSLPSLTRRTRRNVQQITDHLEPEPEAVAGNSGDSEDKSKATKRNRFVTAKTEADAELPKMPTISKYSSEEKPKLPKRRPKVAVEYEYEPEAETIPLILGVSENKSDRTKFLPPKFYARAQLEACNSEAAACSAISKANATDEEEEDEKVSKYFKKSKWEPPNWHQVLDNIRQMRSKLDAPVDTMGCERTMEENVEPKIRRFQTLISLMLSSQTKDEVTFAAMDRLKANVPGGLNVPNILAIDEATLGSLITPVGFWRRKAGYIKKSTEILHEKYGDDIPSTLEDLCSLPGVGPKMAFITLNVAWNQNAGIGVDTHVHRISNRLGWSGPKETKTPEKTRIGLESWLPKEIWQEVNILLVGFGQTICLPINPKCNECKNKEICLYAIKMKANPKPNTVGKPKGNKGSKGKGKEKKMNK